MKKYIKNRRIKKMSIITTICVLLWSTFIVDFLHLNEVQAAIPKSEIKYNEKDNSSVFPDSYKEYIKKLKEAHPNWQIKAFYTNLDWNTVINSEASGTYSRVQDSAYGDAWKRLEESSSSSYNAGGYVLASKSAVAYVMDPRNFLNDKGIFQFRVVDQNIDSDTQNAVNEAMTYTPMKDTDYAKIIQDVGISKSVSPMFIVSRIRQETSCDIVNNGSINGKNSKYPGYYNFFNIGAYDNASSSVQYGINLAYSKGWNTPEKAISGGVDWMKSNYIKYGQNTVYFQKFDVANPYGNATTILSMQYMSNINAPYSESKIAYDGLNRAGKLNNTFTFYIPIYNNMPSVAASYPGENANDYVDDNTVLTVSDSVAPDKLNVRFGPGTGYDVVASLDVGTKVTRIKKSTSSQWDLVKLENGMTGYVFRDYLKEYIMVNSITLNKTELSINVNEIYNLTCTVAPENAANKKIEWSSSNSSVVSVESGKLTAKSGGTATITAKNVESGKNATCKVTVIAKVQSIELDKSEYTMVLGGYLKITPTIKPVGATNKDYTIKSSNEKVIAVENDKIKAVAVGEANITFTTKDQAKTVTAKVKVINQQSDMIKFDNSIKNANGKITGFSMGATLRKLNEKITCGKNYSIVVLNKEGKSIEDTDLITTATTVNLKNSSGDILQSYEVVIPGDINGDGKMTAGDYVKVRNHIMESSKLSGIYLDAADYDCSSKVTAGDYVKIRNKIMSN